MGELVIVMDVQMGHGVYHDLVVVEMKREEKRRGGREGNAEQSISEDSNEGTAAQPSSSGVPMVGGGSAHSFCVSSVGSWAAICAPSELLCFGEGHWREPWPFPPQL